MFRIPLLAVIAYNLFSLMGCGTVREAGQDDWTSTAPVSMTARLEYRVDSLVNENRRLSQQLDAVQTENNNLNLRLTELQAKPLASTTTSLGLSTVPPGSQSKTPPTYESALGKFRTKDYQESIDEFKELLKGGVSTNLADNCEYWIGESYFAMKNYTDAIVSFKAVTTMEGADKADDAQLMIGNAYMAMGDKPAAKQAYQNLITAYPSSPLAPRARARMKNL